MEHGKFAYVGYTGVFNILDYSAVSFPCGVKASKALDASYHGHKALSDVDARIQHDCMYIPNDDSFKKDPRWTILTSEF